MAWPSLHARTKDWGTETLTDADLEGQLDLLSTYINAMMDSATGHKHDGTTAEGPKILTANIDDAAGTAGDVIYSNGSILTRLAIGVATKILAVNAGATAPEWVSLATDDVPDGSVVQVVNFQTGTVSTGTTTIPNDDTIPQNGEGDQYMTLAITPKSATNKLKIDVVLILASTTASALGGGALFQDATAGALAASFDCTSSSASQPSTHSFTHWMTSGTASSTTFNVRAGFTAGTTTFNGLGAGRKYGGALASSITITEIKSS